MTWAKVDDQFHAHRKAKRAWKAHPRALGLHLLALSYCAGQLTDGLVDDEFVEEKVPVVRERTAVTDALVDAGLWVREDDGWQVNDWLDYNPSRADVLNKRQRDSERKARGRGAESARSPNGSAAESASRARVVPTRPDPTNPETPLTPPPGGNRKRALENWERFTLRWARAAGIEGGEAHVLKAARQCAPWRTDDPPAAFRAFCRAHFSGLTVTEPQEDAA